MLSMILAVNSMVLPSNASEQIGGRGAVEIKTPRRNEGFGSSGGDAGIQLEYATR